MKRLIAIICFVIFSMCACNVKELSLEHSLSNIKYYEKEVKSIIAKDGYEMKDESIECDAEYLRQKNWIIELNDTERIEVHFDYDSNPDKLDEVVERVSVYYYKDNADKTFDFDLFVNIVNVFSGKKITADMCKELIEDPKNKYSWNLEDIEKAGLLVSNHRFLNFFEDWSISYEMSKKKEETLEFWGLTEASTK